jgi:hypothetical protein
MQGTAHTAKYHRVTSHIRGKLRKQQARFSKIEHLPFPPATPDRFELVEKCPGNRQKVSLRIGRFLQIDPLLKPIGGKNTKGKSKAGKRRASGSPPRASSTASLRQAPSRAISGASAATA